jgi:hypothetical protein
MSLPRTKTWTAGRFVDPTNCPRLSGKWAESAMQPATSVHHAYLTRKSVALIELVFGVSKEFGSVCRRNTNAGD